MAKNKFLNNTGWIIVGKLAQMVISLFITMITARYLGPSNYGAIAYVSSFVAFFTAIANLGLNNVSVKYIIDKPEKEGEVIGSILAMQLISSIICSVAICILVYFLNQEDVMLIYISFIQVISLIFQSFYIFNYWYQSKLKSKVSTIITFVSYLVMTVYRIIILILQKDITWFAFAITLDVLVVSILLYVSYRRSGGQKLSFSLKLSKELLSVSKHFILSGLMISIYGQMDKVMIGQMLSTTELGYYSTALAICNMWVFILAAIIDSARPLIMTYRKNNKVQYEEGLIKLYSAIIWITIFVSIGISIFAEWIVLILYGVAFLPAVATLRILTWYNAFSYLGVAMSIWLISENMQKYEKVKSGVGAISNLTLNVLFIPTLGITGAAFASLMTQIITNFIMPMFIRDLRPIFIHEIKAFNPRYLLVDVRKLIKNKRS